MIEPILGIAIHFGIQSAFLVAGLWIMIKLQKFDYNILGLIGSAILASGVDMIPYFGHYLSVSVLLFCIRKVIVADSYTDALFTVGIGYALMFCMNLFVIAALMGDLRPVMPVKADSKETDAENQPAAVTNQTNQAMAETGPTTEPGEKTEPANATTKEASAAQGTENAKPVPTPPEVKTNEVSAPLSARDIVSKFKLKGVSKSASQTLAMISTGTKTETIGRGESIQVDTAKGIVSARCDEVSEHKVVLNVEGEKVTLLLY